MGVNITRLGGNYRTLHATAVLPHGAHEEGRRRGRRAPLRRSGQRRGEARDPSPPGTAVRRDVRGHRAVSLPSRRGARDLEGTGAQRRGGEDPPSRGTQLGRHVGGADSFHGAVARGRSVRTRPSGSDARLRRVVVLHARDASEAPRQARKGRHFFASRRHVETFSPAGRARATGRGPRRQDAPHRAGAGSSDRVRRDVVDQGARGRLPRVLLHDERSARILSPETALGCRTCHSSSPAPRVEDRGVSSWRGPRRPRKTADRLAPRGSDSATR